MAVVLEVNAEFSIMSERKNNCRAFRRFSLQAVLADLSTLKVMPLLQIFLFATAT